MAIITNKHRTDLALQDGTVLPAGADTNVPHWDKLKDNAVVKAWQKAGILSAKQADDKKDEGGGDGGSDAEAAELRAKLDELKVEYHPRLGVAKLRKLVEEAEAKKD